MRPLARPAFGCCSVRAAVVSVPSVGVAARPAPASCLGGVHPRAWRGQGKKSRGAQFGVLVWRVAVVFGARLRVRRGFFEFTSGPPAAALKRQVQKKR